jgi:hypothetical protein
LRRLPFHAITQAELAYQRRHLPRRWSRHLAALILVASLLIASLLFAGEVWAAVTYTASATQNRATVAITPLWNLLNLLPVTVTFVLHFALMFQTLSLSANSIAREKRGNHWEMLLLTGVDAGQITFGKWWATVKHMGRRYLLLAVLRALLVVWMGASITRLFTLQAPYYSSTDPAAILPPSLWQFIGAIAAVMALTLANLGFTAACGIIASAVGRGGLLSLMSGLGLRLIILVGIPILATLLIRPLLRGSLAALVDPTGDILLTLLDNGLSIGMSLSRYRYPDEGNFIVFLFPAAVLALALYALLTWLLLRFAQAQLVRQNVLPPLRHAISESV